MKGNSIHAHRAAMELHDVNHLNGIIRGCIWDPQLGPPDQHPNGRFFGEVEWYLTCRQIAHAGDIFNTYCQNILGEILMANPTIWADVDQRLPTKSGQKKKPLRAKSLSVAIASLFNQGEPDSGVRIVLRDVMEAAWCNEVEIICELRNKIVHQAGFDPENEVGAVAKEFPPGMYWLKPTDLNPDEFPVDRDTNGKLVIDARTAHWASRYVAHHIHQMDQNICHRFGVKRSRQPNKSLSFHMREGAHPGILFPGTPLPEPPAVPAPVVAPPLPELPPLLPMANEKEQACAKTWHKIRAELDTIVRRICDDAEIGIRGLECNVAGRPLEHTISNHEMHLGYDLESPDPASTKSNRLGIRIRQSDFEPFVTIWSTKTMMKDFRNIEELDRIEEELITAIHSTLS